jgi:hypothetical protein
MSRTAMPKDSWVDNLTEQPRDRPSSLALQGEEEPKARARRVVAAVPES